MVATIALADIDAGQNDRQTFSEDSLRELADSIEAHGLAQPPTVRRSPAGRYEIVAGERRVRAMRMLGWSEVPAFVRDMDDATASAIMLAENVQRADLDPLEEARAYRSRMDRFGYSVADLAREANVPSERIRKRLSLLSLTDDVARLVSRRLLPLSFAYCLTPLDSNRQLLAIRAYQSSPLTLEQFRALTSRLYGEQQQDSMFDTASFMQVEDYVADAEAAVNDSATLDEVKNPVGIQEIAQRLNVKEQTVSMWRFRSDQGKLPVPMPEPRWVISGVPIWEWSDIEKWDAKRDRKRARKAS